DVSCIMRNEVSKDFHTTGADIHLNLGDMAAAAICRLWRREIGRMLKSNAVALGHRETGHALRKKGKLTKADGRPVAATTGGPSVLEIDIVLGYREMPRSELDD